VDLWELEMKKYLITIERTGYISYTVEATDEDQARELAWEHYSPIDADNNVCEEIFDVEELDDE
jgi:hypothetical protein